MFPVEHDSVMSGRCCPEVQLLLEAQTGFHASIHVGWMGTVGSEKEPSIHSFIRESHYQPGSLCIRITQRWLVNQVGSAGRRQEFGSFQMQPECKCRNSWKCAEFVPKEKRKRSAVKQDLCCSQTAWTIIILSHMLWEPLKYQNNVQVQQLRPVGLHANALSWAAAGFHLSETRNKLYGNI